MSPRVGPDARSLSDGVVLSVPRDVTREDSPDSIGILPWIGFGTYKLGKENAKLATLQALETGYRMIDTAFIYASETCEVQVGHAVQQAISDGILSSRQDVFITTKHWRKYHGYEASLTCLELSLSRLQTTYVDLWLMHWPGPAYNTMARRKDADAWSYTDINRKDMVRLRGETWRAMEDAWRQGKARAIGVSNMTVKQLEALKKTATIWPPAVNQVEFHPLQSQEELRDYCQKEGIILQGYASLGGQDTGKKTWNQLLRSDDDSFKDTQKVHKSLMDAYPVISLATRIQATPAQVLLRWSLEHGCPVIPKTTSVERMKENAGALSVSMTTEERDKLEFDLVTQAAKNVPDAEELRDLTRLCWRRDPLRQLDFE